MANKQYIAPETATTWRDTGGDLAMTLAGLVADGARVGARKDLGAASRSQWYEWRVQIDGFDTAPVVGESINIYIATSDGSIEDGNVGAIDAAVATAALPNLTYLRSAIVQTTTATDELQVSGLVKIVARYVSPVIHNDTVNNMETTTPTHQFILIPIPPELQ